MSATISVTLASVNMAGSRAGGGGAVLAAAYGARPRRPVPAADCRRRRGRRYGTMVPMKPRRTAGPRRARRGDGVVRVQTGLRIDRRLHKVLRGLADYLDVSLGDLIELIALRAFADPEG